MSWAFLPRWTACGGPQCVDSVNSDYENQQERPSYTVVNVMLDFQITVSSVLTLRGFNLFEEVYGQTRKAICGGWGSPRPSSSTAISPSDPAGQSASSLSIRWKKAPLTLSRRAPLSSTGPPAELTIVASGASG